MCDQCLKIWQRGGGALRPAEELDGADFARLAKARRTSDPRKLRALLPAWIKAHEAAARKWWTGEPETRPDPLVRVLSYARNLTRDERNAGHFRQFDTSSTAAYVASVERLWQHVPAKYEGRAERKAA